MFSRKTVDGVLAAFNKTINDLQSIATTCREEIDVIDAKIDNLNQQGDELAVEAARAEDLIDNFKNLINA